MAKWCVAQPRAFAIRISRRRPAVPFRAARFNYPISLFMPRVLWTAFYDLSGLNVDFFLNVHSPQDFQYMLLLCKLEWFKNITHLFFFILFLITVFYNGLYFFKDVKLYENNSGVFSHKMISTYSFIIGIFLLFLVRNESIKINVDDTICRMFYFSQR
jgi:hypothetical protein